MTRSATAHRYAVEMLVVAGHFPVGTIVERHGDAVLARNDGPEVSA